MATGHTASTAELPYIRVNAILSHKSISVFPVFPLVQILTISTGEMVLDRGTEGAAAFFVAAAAKDHGFQGLRRGEEFPLKARHFAPGDPVGSVGSVGSVG